MSIHIWTVMSNDEFDEDAAWEAARGDSSSDDDQFESVALKRKQQEKENAMWEEINTAFDFTNEKVEDFALKSLTILEQNFGFVVPDPSLDYTEEFGGSVKNAQKEIETGRVEIPAEGIYIKSARLTSQRGSDVYFKLQRVKTIVDAAKPLKLLDNLCSGYLNILASLRQVRLTDISRKMTDIASSCKKYSEIASYGLKLVRGITFIVLKLETFLNTVRKGVKRAEVKLDTSEKLMPSDPIKFLSRRRLFVMSLALRLINTVHSVASLLIGGAIIAAPPFAFFGGDETATSIVQQFNYFLGENAKLVNNQRSTALKQNVPLEIIQAIDSIHKAFARDFQKLFSNLDSCTKVITSYARIQWIQCLAKCHSVPVHLDIRCPLLPTNICAAAEYLLKSNREDEHAISEIFNCWRVLGHQSCLFQGWVQAIMFNQAETANLTTEPETNLLLITNTHLILAKRHMQNNESSNLTQMLIVDIGPGALLAYVEASTPALSINQIQSLGNLDTIKVVKLDSVEDAMDQSPFSAKQIKFLRTVCSERSTQSKMPTDVSKSSSSILFRSSESAPQLVLTFETEQCVNFVAGITSALRTSAEVSRSSSIIVRAPHNAHTHFKTQIVMLNGLLEQYDYDDYSELCDGRVGIMNQLVSSGILDLPEKGVLVRKGLRDQLNCRSGKLYLIKIDPQSKVTVVNDLITRAANIAGTEMSKFVLSSNTAKDDAIALATHVFLQLSLREYLLNPCLECCSENLQLLDSSDFFDATGTLDDKSGAFPVQKSAFLNCSLKDIENHFSEKQRESNRMNTSRWVELCSEIYCEDSESLGKANVPSSFWWLRERELLLAGPGHGSSTGRFAVENCVSMWLWKLFKRD